MATMPHPLDEFCAEARESLKEAREVLAGCSAADAFPAEAREAFASLYLRARRAAIRVLVMGPLKAGKSTLLNVLAQDPHISQISQLPTYPCFVEVRDLERNSAGEPTEPAKAFFYDSDGALAKEMSPEEGQRFLDQLLNEFIEEGSGAAVQYERVVQRTDFPQREEGVDLVLVDSPGLFFRAAIDRRLLPGERGREGASPVVKSLLSETDVVIFVVRPEQLFFQSVAEYLSNFVHATRMRIFVLVNASTRSKTQRGTEIVDFDQVEEQGEIRQYFLQHLADEELADALHQGLRISLHFADLLAAATAHFAPEGDAEAFLRTRSGDVLARLRATVFGADLARWKIHNLREGIREVIERSERHLAALAARFGDDLLERRARLSSSEEGFESTRSRADEARRAEDDARTRHDECESRLRAVEGYMEDDSAAEETTDWILEEFEELRQGSPLLEKTGLRLEATYQAKARDNIDNIYRRWRAGEYGPRTLRALGEALWEAKPEADALSLRSYAQNAVLECFQELLRHARSAASPRLSQFVTRIDEQRVQVHSPNPVLPRDVPLTLLHFRAPWSFRWHAWSTAFRLTPRMLWGPDGEREITDPDEERVLFRQRKALLQQIWGPPWDVGSRFSARHLQSVARRILLGKIGRSWGFYLTEQLQQLKRRLTEAERELSQASEDFSVAAAELESLRDRLEARLRHAEELHSGARRLASILEEFVARTADFVQQPAQE